MFWLVELLYFFGEVIISTMINTQARQYFIHTLEKSGIKTSEL